MSKIQFWKQITTPDEPNDLFPLLFSICQRYNFESKSQLKFLLPSPVHRCFRYVKDTILKANHNFKKILSYEFEAVFDMSKIQFWKQITTYLTRVAFAEQLFSICQRYNFESKSQLYQCKCAGRKSCFRYVKDTILKANHNSYTIFFNHLLAVFDMSKIQFWKQITTSAACQWLRHSCFRYVKDTILKANHNY